MREETGNERIAIIGLGCRFPGGADGPAAFWQLLQAGREAVREIPAERWGGEALYDPDPEAPGKIYARHASLLDQVDGFDPLFFGISPREAASLDPQQRLLLEVTWEALEHAGQAPAGLRHSETGVFIGISQNDYARFQLTGGRLDRISPYDGTGNGLAYAAGRLSYTLGLQGPSMAVDTTCSSSLVALHLACQSLWSGECDLALAGGVQLMLSPEISVFLARMRALAPDGRCKTFDAAGNGYGRGEGCGVVVLKRLDEARQAGDPILALIRSTAINHDGPGSGLTVPNSQAQEAMLRRALQRGKLSPEQISYIEAHGTGTPLGDQTELAALAAVFGPGRPADQPLRVGSVKTNIGHLEAAAGIAGVIKVALALQHEEIPAHLHFKTPTPRFDWAAAPLVVPTRRQPWPRGPQPRRAGVSAFGFSGTNAHVILEEAPPVTVQPVSPARSYHLLPLSARTETALDALAGRYEAHLPGEPAGLAEVAATAGNGRTHFNHRLAVVARSTGEAGQMLAAWRAGEAVPGLQVGQAGQPRPVFFFPGGGPAGLDQALYETQPVFRQAVDRCARILEAYGDDSLLKRAAFNRPAAASFALGYALAELWQAWGVSPQAVVGQGVGELVAACRAGVFSLEEGLRLSLAAETPGQNGTTPAKFAAVAGAVSYTPPHLEVLSEVTGPLDRAKLASAAYWVNEWFEAGRQIVEAGPEHYPPARLDTLFQSGYTALVVCGFLPPVLESRPGWFPSLRSGELGWQTLLHSLAALYVQGVAVDWAAVEPGRQKAALPVYPFQRQRYWIETERGQLRPEPAQTLTSQPSPSVIQAMQSFEANRILPTSPSSLIQRLETAPAGERRSLLLAHVRSEVASLLRLSAPEQLPLQQRLFDLGLDAAGAMALRNRLESSLGRPLRSMLVFDYPTLELLVDYLAHLEPEDPPDLAGEGLDQLSLEELTARLAQKLAEIDE